MNTATAEQHDCAKLDEKKNHFFDIIVHRSIEKIQGAWFLTFDNRSDVPVSRCPICGTTLEVQA
jgi:hypothetical protein